jgi:alpha-amylase
MSYFLLDEKRYSKTTILSIYFVINILEIRVMKYTKLAIALSVSVILSACGGGSSTPTPSPSPTPAPTPAPTPIPTKDFGPLELSAGDIPPQNIFVRGSYNDWSTTSFVENDGVYLSAINLPAGNIGFKVADQDWLPGTDCGLDGGQLSPGEQVLDLSCNGPGNGNIVLSITEPGFYTVAFSYSDQQTASVQVYPSVSDACAEDPASVRTLGINYLRQDNQYSTWLMHATGDALSYCVNHPALLGIAFSNADENGAHWQLPIVLDDEQLSLSFRSVNASSKSGTVSVSLADFANEIWVIEGDRNAYSTQEEALAAFDELGNQSRLLDLSVVEVTDSSSALPLDWAKTANFMEIYVRGYQDSDGDGVGDIQGLISRLDYLQELGINGIWLMPVHESTDNDHGYQVEDYRDIEDAYGTTDDYQQLLQAAHSRGIGIIMDYVINHSSNANPLFKDADFSANNDKRDWYIFEETNPGWSSFSGASWHAGTSGYYYGVFFGGMPDFNLRNQEVVDFHHNNLRYWLNMGVDGFRFDATGLLVENGISEWEDQDENHPILREVRSVIDNYDNRFTVCESPSDAARYAEADSCGRAFAFGSQFDIIDSADFGTLKSGLVNALNRSTRDNMPLILSNHDAFAGDRMGTRFSNNETDYRVASAIYLLASSTPFTYYGEEIGLANGSNLQSDASLRTPMSWTDESVHAGFSTTSPFRTLSANYQTNNVLAQQADPDSLYHYYQAIYHLRKAYPVLATGDFELLSAAGEPTLLFTRSNSQNSLVVAINLSTQAQSVSIQTGLVSATGLQLLPGSELTVNSDTSGMLDILIPAKTALVYGF